MVPQEARTVSKCLTPDGRVESIKNIPHVSENFVSFRLGGIRADGWFERLGEGSPTFDQLCEVVGARFVAFAVVLGVRITAVSVDSRVPEASVIDFAVGDGGPAQRLPLSEFRRRLAGALLTDEPNGRALPAAPTPDDLLAFIGFRWVLLSSIFGITLEELHVGENGHASIAFKFGGKTDELSLEPFRGLIRDLIRDESARAKPASPFAIDLNVMPDVVAAANVGEHDKVIELIGAWPGPLSLLLRTAEGQSLAPDVKATLARALGLLGSAYVALDRVDWAEEVLRLGIQWGQESPAAADLYRRLAEAHSSNERHGEAIGMFRRALQLGAPKPDILPQLAAAFASRHRHLAALICIEDAVVAGASEAALVEVREEALGALGEHWTRFKQFLAN